MDGFQQEINQFKKYTVVYKAVVLMETWNNCHGIGNSILLYALQSGLENMQHVPLSIFICDFCTVSNNLLTLLTHFKSWIRSINCMSHLLVLPPKMLTHLVLYIFYIYEKCQKKGHFYSVTTLQIYNFFNVLFKYFIWW